MIISSIVHYFNLVIIITLGNEQKLMARTCVIALQKEMSNVQPAVNKENKERHRSKADEKRDICASCSFLFI